MELTTKLRIAGNSGSFYPAQCGVVKSYIKDFTKHIDSITNPKLLKNSPRAIISPHAGYVYSGFTANAAHRALSNAKPERVIVIGPSHHVYFEGVSTIFTNKFETPCGDILCDLEYMEKLQNRFNFTYSEIAHYREHSTETQFPFIKHYNPQAKIIELIYGKISWYEIAEIINFAFSGEDTAIVISSDLSHFYSLRKANSVDMICLKAIEKADLNLLDQGCEACGITGIKAIIDVANNLKLKTGIIDYRTSADASGDESRVVGYAGAVVF